MTRRPGKSKGPAVAPSTVAEVLEILRADNPRARAGDLAMYADAFMEYREAQDNIAKNGAIAMHPRTGAPIENPYLRVRNGAAAVLRKFRLVSDKLWP